MNKDTRPTPKEMAEYKMEEANKIMSGYGYNYCLDEIKYKGTQFDKDNIDYWREVRLEAIKLYCGNTDKQNNPTQLKFDI